MEAKSVFPEDVLEEILSRLTARKLLQLRSICKLWCFTIDKHSFIQKHHQTQYAQLKETGDIPLFCNNAYSTCLLEDDPTHFCLLSNKLENDIIYLTSDFIRDFSQHCTDKPVMSFNFLFCCGIVNGIILFPWAEFYWLWNPAIRELKSIPQPRPDRALPDNLKEYRPSLVWGLIKSVMT